MSSALALISANQDTGWFAIPAPSRRVDGASNLCNEIAASQSVNRILRLGPNMSSFLSIHVQFAWVTDQ